MLHVLENAGKIGERNFSGDEIAGAHFAARDGVERFTNETRRVMESRLDGDFRIVKERGIELHLRAARAPAEEIHAAALANHFDGPLPRGRRADGFDDSVGAAAAFGELADKLDGAVHFGDVECSIGAETLGGFNLTFALAESYDADVTARKNADEFQSDGAAADDDGGVARTDLRFINAAKDAGERLDQGGVVEADVFRNLEQILPDDAARDAHVFGISAVIEQEVFAEIGLLLAAVETGAARRGIRGDNAH